MSVLEDLDLIDEVIAESEREFKLLRIQKQIAVNNSLILQCRIQEAMAQQGLNIIDGYYDKQFEGAIREYLNHAGENY